MEEKIEKLEEGKNEVVLDNSDNTVLAETSPATQESLPEAHVEEQVPALDSNPVPTEEEKEDANLVEDSAPESDNDSVEEKVDDDVSEDNSVVENVDSASNSVEPVEEAKFTQSQVNDMIGKTRVETRNKTFEYIYGRYGVNDENGLDDLVGNAQRFDSLKSEYDGERANWKQESDARNNELLELKEKVALMESGIDRERYDDAKFILKGKGLEINADNIASELASHPEWKKEEKVYTPKEEPPTSKISVLGNEKAVPEHTETEEDYAMDKLFKVR